MCPLGVLIYATICAKSIIVATMIAKAA